MRRICPGYWLLSLVTVVIALTILTPTAHGQDDATAGRDILSKFQDAIVTIRLVVNSRMVVEGREMQKSENRLETAATIIDPSGLAVLSLSSTNPGEMMSRIMPRLGGSEGPTIKMESSASDVKMRMADGQEVPAQIVLQDKDLDMAFVRPTEKLSRALPALDLTNEAKPKVLDQIVFLSRLGKVASWAPSATLDRIRAVVEKPRTFYVPNLTSGSMETGTPAFSLDGKVIGVLLLRFVPSDGSGLFSMTGGLSTPPLLPVVLPAADIREVAKQAPPR